MFFSGLLVFAFCGFLLTACDNGNSPSTGTETYTVTIGTLINANGNTITANSVSGPAGTEITLTVSETNGYRLKADTLKYNSTPINETTKKFIMPAENVTVTAEWENILTVSESYRGIYSIGEGGVLDLTETTAVVDGTTHTGIYTQTGGTITAEDGGTYVYFYKDGTKIGVGAQSLTGGIQLFFGIAADSGILNTNWGASPVLDFSDLGDSPFNCSAGRTPEPDNALIAGVWVPEDESEESPPYLRFNLSDNTVRAPPLGDTVGTYSLNGDTLTINQVLSGTASVSGDVLTLADFQGQAAALNGSYTRGGELRLNEDHPPITDADTDTFTVWVRDGSGNNEWSGGTIDRATLGTWVPEGSGYHILDSSIVVATPGQPSQFGYGNFAPLAKSPPGRAATALGTLAASGDTEAIDLLTK